MGRKPPVLAASAKPEFLPAGHVWPKCTQKGASGSTGADLDGKGSPGFVEDVGLEVPAPSACSCLTDLGKKQIPGPWLAPKQTFPLPGAGVCESQWSERFRVPPGHFRRPCPHPVVPLGLRCPWLPE